MKRTSNRPDNAQAIRFLNIADVLVNEAANDLREGRRPDFEELGSIYDQASDWAIEQDLHPRVKTDLNGIARKASNLLCEGF